MDTYQETIRNKLCIREWEYLQLGSLGRAYLQVYLSLLLLQAGDVERNPGPTPGKWLYKVCSLHFIVPVYTSTMLENVEHCGGEPERACH